jgi:putative DNA primase/helicase
MMDLASPTSAFVRERCIRKPDESVAADVLYSNWKTWAEENGHHAVASSTFGRNLRAAVPEVKVTNPRRFGTLVRTYARIGLLPSSAQVRADQAHRGDEGQLPSDRPAKTAGQQHEGITAFKVQHGRACPAAG